MYKLFQPTGEGEPETFTQEQVDKMLEGRHDQKTVDQIVEDRLNRDRKSREGKNSELIKKLESLQEAAGTSEEQRQSLETQLETLRTDGQTKEQQQVRETARAQKKHEKDLQEATTERDFWKDQFSGQMLQTTIRAAATEHEALPQAHDQLVAILGSKNARIVEGKAEDGKPNGEFHSVVTFQDKDDDGKAIVIDDMPVSDAIKRMKDLPDLFGNLFKTSANGGAGGSTQGGGSPGSKDFATMSMSDYREARNAGKGPAQKS